MAYYRTNAGAAALATARLLTGKEYVYGGEFPEDDGTDCSGLAQWAYGKLGLILPRTSELQCRLYELNDRSIPNQPGDIHFSPGDPRDANPGHEVIYVSEGQCFQAEETGTRIGQFPWDTDNWEFRTRPALAFPEPPAVVLPRAAGKPTTGLLTKAGLVSMANVAQAEEAEHNGWPLYYFAKTWFVEQQGGKPTGVTLFANRNWKNLRKA